MPTIEEINALSKVSLEENIEFSGLTKDPTFAYPKILKITRKDLNSPWEFKPPDDFIFTENRTEILLKFFQAIRKASS